MMNINIFDIYIEKLKNDLKNATDEATLAKLQEQLSQVMQMMINSENSQKEAERLYQEQGYYYPDNDAFVPHLPKFTILPLELEQELIHDVQFYYKNYKSSNEAIKIIQEKFNLSPTLANLYFGTCSNALRNQMEMDANLADDVEYFKYSGYFGASRKFCKEHFDKVYHIDEILKMDNKQKLPVIYFCGGYDCSHKWFPVYDFEYEKYGIKKP